MVKTITIGSCVSVQGMMIRVLENGRAIVQVGQTQYSGQLVKQ